MQKELVIGLSEATYGPTVANSQETTHHRVGEGCGDWLEGSKVRDFFIQSAKLKV
jgi:hypothetical protein